MGNVVLIAEVRAARLRQALEIHARNGDPVIIDTPNGRINAHRINCRALFAEILDGYGEYFVVDYNDIRSIQLAPGLQTSVVNALPVQSSVMTQRPVAILPFAPRRRGK